MRADIHDGPEHMLQTEAGYIDARPLTPARQNLLQRTAGPYNWVKRVILTVHRPLPVYPYQQTSSRFVSMSQTCQKLTGAPQRGERYSITSSARTSNVGKMVRPSPLAVARFITSSNFVGCWTGRSAGFAPLMMASTCVAARRYMSIRSGP